MEGLVRVGSPEAGVGGCHGGRWDRGEDGGENGRGRTRGRPLARALSLGCIWCADPILYRARPSLRPDPTRHPPPPGRPCLIWPPHAVRPRRSCGVDRAMPRPGPGPGRPARRGQRRSGYLTVWHTHCPPVPLARSWRTRTALSALPARRHPPIRKRNSTARSVVRSQGPRPPAANKNAPKPCLPAPVAARHIRVQASILIPPIWLSELVPSRPPPRLILGPLLSLLTSKCSRILSYHSLHSYLPPNRRHMPARPRPSLQPSCHQIS